MSLVPRRVQPIEQPQSDERQSPEQALEVFRWTPAWVLLGEPGAGKSEALKMEAEETGGQYLTASELISANPIPDQWRGKTLFIDALDEARATGADSLTLRISNQLRNLDCPSFRLSCRVADWLGPTDKADLEHLSPDGKLIALQLCPLDEADIRYILKSNHGVNDPEDFSKQAARHGIASLLRNPQTLGLMAKAIHDGHWPESRTEVYRLACETLAQENNRRHRGAQRTSPIDASAILNSAGQLFAVLLIAGKTGISLDLDASAPQFPTLQELLPTSLAVATKAQQSKLFMPASDHDERLMPCHRSVAEYLAANWLGECLDRYELPLERLLNLLLGCDGGIVADLRGLFAWLAQCSTIARPRLIEVDPLGIVLYGDVRPLSAVDKRHLLQALHKQAEDFPGFRWYLQYDQEAFGALADKELVEDFRRILQAHQRDDVTQSHMDCVLDILHYGVARVELAEPLLFMIKDASLWLRLRKSALNIWLALSTSVEAKQLLREIGSNLIEDSDDELLGRLLGQLYPNNLEPAELLQYLHRPKDSHLIGGYCTFWDYRLSEQAPNHHIPALLGGLSQQQDVFDDPYIHGDLSRTVGQLAVRALDALGDTASDEQLFTWLGAGADKYGCIRREKEVQAAIQKWFESRPERYKAVFSLCVQAAVKDPRYHQYARLQNISAPLGLGLWNLQQAALEAEDVAKIHLRNVVQFLELQIDEQGISLEVLASWADKYPERAAWLDMFLVCPIEEWRRESAASTNSYKLRCLEERHKRTLKVAPYLPEISAGTAEPHLLDQMASVWLGHFSDICGETPSERFSIYSELGDELMLAAECGIKLSLQRVDLPTTDEIIALNLKKRRHWISKPCLLGLQLLFSESPKLSETLSDDIVERLLAFRLILPHIGLTEWLAQMARQRPVLFANLLARYAIASFKAGESSVEVIHLLDKSDDYALVSALAVPQLLSSFPLRAKKEQLNSLKRLIDKALVTANFQDELLRYRLSLKGMDSAQKTLWLAMGLHCNPELYESKLWRHIGTSLTHASLLAEFICRRVDSRKLRISVPENTLGRLIELIAPHAELELVRGYVTDARERGDQIRTMVSQLGTSTNDEAEKALHRLQDNPALSKLRYEIQSTLNQQRNKRREAQFNFLDHETVARVLANREPANVGDLAALTLNHIDEIAHQLRHANDDGFRAFWNITQGKPINQRDENLCRDVLLRLLRPLLSAQGVSIDPEADHAGDKRADLYLDYRNQFALPIEIKRDSHPQLWKALRSQLIAQYVNAPKSRGHGIYLVFWFGDPKKPTPTALDGGQKPKSHQELQARLEALLSDEERQRVLVRVLDVSWP
ncbi:hypothetical protein [Pseudomonas chlororaphis]|uniref:hypothetical protein n=1 Tax=Pseudomonas chlororaphis TaxID=587753 RepID=UPI00138A3837|nr:hypothetical protein [Pseudomonas chlororaphis]